jgi:translation elongation factor EF-1alpha
MEELIQVKIFYYLIKFSKNYLCYICKIGICPWYKEASFFEMLNKCPIPKRSAEGPIRLPILSYLKTENSPMYIYGKIESGIIK